MNEKVNIMPETDGKGNKEQRAGNLKYHKIRMPDCPTKEELKGKKREKPCLPFKYKKGKLTPAEEKLEVQNKAKDDTRALKK